MSKALFKAAGLPHNKELIERVNWDIDNSPMYLLAAANMAKKNKTQQSSFDMFNLVHGGGHRMAHNNLFGLLIASQNARAMGVPMRDAMMGVFSHYMTDNLSNHLVNKLGREGKDLWEAVYNFQTRRPK